VFKSAVQLVHTSTSLAH